MGGINHRKWDGLLLTTLCIIFSCFFMEIGIPTQIATSWDGAQLLWKLGLPNPWFNHHNVSKSRVNHPFFWWFVPGIYYCFAIVLLTVIYCIYDCFSSNMMIKHMIEKDKTVRWQMNANDYIPNIYFCSTNIKKKKKHYNLGDGESYCFPNIPLHPTTHLTQSVASTTESVQHNRRLRSRCGWQSRLQVM